MRSNLISGCFLAYGFGNISINLVTLVIRSASTLSITSLLLVCFSIIPSFFSYVETPRFQYKAGRLSGLVQSLMNMATSNRKNITKEDILQDFTDGDENMADALADKQIRVSIKKDPKSVEKSN